MNIDKILEEFDEEFSEDAIYHKNFLIKAIISEYKSLREELLGYYPRRCDCVGEKYECEHWGYQNAIDDQFANIDKKIINLESKLK